MQPATGARIRTESVGSGSLTTRLDRGPARRSAPNRAPSAPFAADSGARFEVYGRVEIASDGRPIPRAEVRPPARVMFGVH